MKNLGIFKKSVFFIIFLLLINITPHIVVRIFAESNAIKIFSDVEPLAEFDGTIRVAAYNIAHGRGDENGAKNWNGESEEDRKSRLLSIASFLKEQNVDVVILNEVDFNADWSHNVNQAEFVARKAGFPYRVEQRNYDIYHPLFRLQFGNAVLSKYPIEGASLLQFTPLSKLEDMVFGNHDGAVVDLILGEGLTISVVALHLEFRSRASRLKTYETLEGLISQSAIPTILAGDLNSEKSLNEPQGSIIDKLSGIDGVESFPNSRVSGNNFTFPSVNPSRTIDWILAPLGTKIVSGQVHKEMWSDHLPLIVDIEI